jgi:hypothetical protein
VLTFINYALIARTSIFNFTSWFNLQDRPGASAPTSLSIMAYMFCKTITYSDIDEGRVYIPPAHVDTFGVENGTIVAVCNDQNDIWDMKFIRRANSKYYLGSAWKDFCQSNGLIQGSIISFFDLGIREANGQRLFQIIERGIDLNLPPPQ